MDSLRSSVPGLIGNIGLGPFGDFTSTQNDPQPENAEGRVINDSFSQFMSRMVSAMGNWDPNAPPEERYKLQMDYLKTMGFDNEEKNLQMLTACFGDVNSAVQRLLMQNDQV